MYPLEFIRFFTCYEPVSALTVVRPEAILGVTFMLLPDIQVESGPRFRRRIRLSRGMRMGARRAANA